MSWPNQSGAHEPAGSPTECENNDFESLPLPWEELIPPYEWEERASVRPLEQQTIDDLHWLAEHTGRDETELINHAVQLYRRITEIKASGVEIVIRRGGNETEVLDIP